MNYNINGSKLVMYGERFEFKKPITAEIFLTEFCNKGCGFCRFKNGKKYMNFMEFKNVANRLLDLGVKGFNITGGGEPLLNPDIHLILDWMDEKKLAYGINTYLPFAPKNKPRWIKINDNFDVVKPADIEKIDPETVVGVQLVLDGSTMGVKDFHEKWKNSRVDYMVVRPVEAVTAFHSKEDPEKVIQAVKEINDERLKYNYKWEHVFDAKFSRCKAS